MERDNNSVSGVSRINGEKCVMNELLRERYDELKNRQKYFMVDYEELGEMTDKQVSDNNENEYCFESQFDMDYPTDVWCEQFVNARYDSPIYIYGIGHYLYLKKLIKSIQFGVIVVYEPDIRQFAKFLCCDVKDVLDTKGIYFITGKYRQRYLRNTLENFLNYNNRLQLYIANIPNYSKRHDADYEEFCNIIKIKCENVMAEKCTAILHDGIQSYNYLNNLFTLVDEAGIQEVCDAVKRFNQYPAVVVAAGPSLDKNVKLLKNYKGKVFIVAVEAALNTLNKNGIVPDLIVTVDPYFEKLKAFQNKEFKNLPMIVNMISGYKLLNGHTGRKFFDVQQDNIIGMIEDNYNKILPILGTGGSVANSAFSFLQLVGFDTIILIGQDLAYPNNKFHASGAFENEGEIDNASGKYYYVEDIYGGKVLTEKNMDLYRLWFEDIIKDNENINVIDATEGGALIKGTKIMTLQEALDKYAAQEVADFVGAINRAKYLFNEEERIQANKEIAGMYSSVDEVIAELRQGKKLYNQLEDLCNKGKSKTKKFYSVVEKIKALTDYIDNNPMMAMFELYAEEERTKVIDDMQTENGDFAHEIRNLAGTGRKMLDAYMLAGERIKKDWKNYCDKNVEKKY